MLTWCRRRLGTHENPIVSMAPSAESFNEFLQGSQPLGYQMDILEDSRIYNSCETQAYYLNYRITPFCNISMCWKLRESLFKCSFTITLGEQNKQIEQWTLSAAVHHRLSL